MSFHFHIYPHLLLAKMNPSFNHLTHQWTKSLLKVEKINLGKYGLSPMPTLRGIAVDHEFLRACCKFWDVDAHVFRLGAECSELCPLFEEFCSIIGCDPNAPLVHRKIQIGYLRCFRELFGFTSAKVSEIVPGEQKAILSFLMDEFLEPNSEDPDQMMFRRRAFVFCLTAGFIFN